MQAKQAPNPNSQCSKPSSPAPGKRRQAIAGSSLGGKTIWMLCPAECVARHLKSEGIFLSCLCYRISGIFAMRLSTQIRYGARAMVELGLAYPERVVSVREMAESQHLSVKYLERIMVALKTAGLVTPVRGIHGGYALARPPSSITLGEVYRILEGSPAVVYCVDHPESCPLLQTCPTRDTWVELTAAVQGVLEGTTLEDLVERTRRRRSRVTPAPRTSAALGITEIPSQHERRGDHGRST